MRSLRAGTVSVSALRVLSCVAGLSIAACARPESAPARVDSLGQILVAVPDSAMRDRWRDAAAKGQLAPLESLPVPNVALATRTPVTVGDTGRVAQLPTISPQTAAELRVASLDAPDRYSGTFTVVSAGAGRVSGTITGRQNPLELIYRMPADSAVTTSLRAGTGLRLSLRDEVVGQSQRAEVLLTDAGRVPVMFQLSDGSARPYARRFEEIPLTVTQLPPGRDGESAVAVTLGDARNVLRAGQQAVFAMGAARVEVRLLSSTWTAADKIETAEGDPFHVRMVAYRSR